MNPSLSVTGNTCEIAPASTRHAAPNQRLLHHRGSLMTPNAASTLTAPSAQVNQCDAAASGIGMLTPQMAQAPWLKKNHAMRAAPQQIKAGPHPQFLRRNSNKKYAR